MRKHPRPALVGSSLGGFYATWLAERFALRALEVNAITPEHYLLMVETGADVLDYRQAVAKYRGARQIVIDGGDHGFSDFGDYLDHVIEFCGIAP